MSERLIIVLIPGGGGSEQAVASRMDTVGRSQRMMWHGCPVMNAGGTDEKQMGLSVRSILPPLVNVSIHSKS